LDGRYCNILYTYLFSGTWYNDHYYLLSFRIPYTPTDSCKSLSFHQVEPLAVLSKFEMSAPPNSPPPCHDEQLPVVVATATITSSWGDFQCCLCLDIGSDSNLRAECFHRFCRTCFNIGEIVRELNLDKCPACLKDLDETVSPRLPCC
jgi:hypothetical protein